MYNDIDPKNPDLILYIPMNEGVGTTLHDLTGNGHDVEIGNASQASNAQSVTWIGLRMDAAMICDMDKLYICTVIISKADI